MLSGKVVGTRLMVTSIIAVGSDNQFPKEPVQPTDQCDLLIQSDTLIATSLSPPRNSLLVGWRWSCAAKHFSTSPLIPCDSIALLVITLLVTNLLLTRAPTKDS